MKLPSREEIRHKYKITESDFAILAAFRLPSSDSLRQEETQMERLGYWGRFEVWLKRSFLGGAILAIIFLGELNHGLEAVSKYGRLVYTSWQPLAGYAQNFARYTTVVSTDLATPTSTMPIQENGPHEKRVALSMAGTVGIQANSITPFGRWS